MKLRWQNFNELIEDCAHRFGTKPALSIYQQDHWQALSFTELASQSKLRAESLLRSGHKIGDRIAILSTTSLDWVAEFLGIVRIGCIAVPLDPKATERELEIWLAHVEPRSFIIAKEFRHFAFQMQSKLGIEKVMYLEELYAMDKPPEELPIISQNITAAIYYTSGTAGSPKGVMISVSSMLAELSLLSDYQENETGSVIFSILPLHHLYGLVAGALYSMVCGAEYVFAHSLAPSDIRFCLVEKNVSQLCVVPLLLQLMHRSIQERIRIRKKREKILFHILYSISAFLPLFLRRKLFTGLLKQIGGRLERIVSGGAPLDLNTYQFFHRIGIPIFEGYGLTETGPVITVNTPKHNRKGTVGRPLPSIELKIEHAPGEIEGEICTRGTHVMQGYFKNDSLTREVITEDGWFKTGDLGRIENGYLKIVGRKKSLIALYSGKKVYAEEVEQVISRSELFQEYCVLGIPEPDRGEQVVAVIYPSAKLLIQDVVDQKRLVEQEVQALSKELAPFKRPIRTIVLNQPIPKTSSGKIKRFLLKEQIMATNQ